MGHGTDLFHAAHNAEPRWRAVSVLHHPQLPYFFIFGHIKSSKIVPSGEQMVYTYVCRKELTQRRFKLSLYNYLIIIMKELVIFDLDGTLNVSKQPIDEEMGNLICELLNKTKVVIVSGATFTRVEKQFLKNLNCSSDKLSKLFLMPTSGSSLYTYKQNGWVQVYEELLSEKDRVKIRQALESAVIDANITSPENIYGELIHDKGSQVTYSALGQEAPTELKEKWDPDHKKRDKIVKALSFYIPEFEVRIGGTTSIDVTKKGIDKAYGIQKIEKSLNIRRDNMLFIGDAVFPGGNDYSVKEAGVKTIQVSGPEETKEIIRELLKIK